MTGSHISFKWSARLKRGVEKKNGENPCNIHSVDEDLCSEMLVVVQLETFVDMNRIESIGELELGGRKTNRTAIHAIIFSP